MAGLPARLWPDDIFGADHSAGDVTQRSVRGSVTTFGAQGARFVLQTLTTVVLARLLSPDDFGLVAMVALVMGFAQVFKDAGLSTATIQRPSITEDQVSALFWVNIAVSVALMMVVSISSPLVAAFFHRPELVPVTVALSVTFFVGGLSIQHDALLRRRLQFGALAVIQVVSQLTNLVVAVTVAMMPSTQKYWALVAGALASTACATVLTFYYCPLVPSRARKGSGVRAILSFGGQLMTFEFVNYFARNLDNLLVGRSLGSSPLGLYSKAYQLFMLPITQIRTPLSQVALPALSRLRGEGERYRRFYVRIVEVTAALTVPLTVYCLIEASFLVRVLLGGQWMGAVRTFQILAIAGIVQPTASTVGLVMVSQGRADRQLKNGLVNSLVLALAFVIGLPFGIEGVAAGFTVGSLIVVVPMLYYGFHETPIRVGDFARSVWPSVLAGVISGGLGLLAGVAAGRESAWGHIALASVFVLAYMAFTLPRRSVQEGIQVVRSAWVERVEVDPLPEVSPHT